MSRAVITESYLTGIANAIRAKLGVQTIYTPGQMAAAIESIPAGSSITVEALNVTENGTYTAPSGKAYSPVTVNVSGGGNTNILSGVSEPSASQGNNGDLYLQTYDVPTLPVGYTPAKFVKTNGQACFDTNYVYRADTTIEAAVMVLSYPSSYPHVFTAWSGNATRSMYFCPAHSGLSSKVSYIFNSAEVNTGKTFPLRTRLKIRANISGATWYDEQGNVIDSVSVSGGNYAGSTSLKLMGGGADDTYVDMRMYWCKIYEGDTIVHHYVPCKNASDVVGVYDLVAEAFLQNASSGSMSCEEAFDGEIIAAYLKVSGAWQTLIGSNISDVGGVTT